MLTRWLLVVLLSLHTRAFNLDLRYPHVYQTDMPGDYFGFSVALHPGSPSPDDPAWMMVGAPRGNRSDARGVHQPGRVLQCRFGEPCELLYLDPNSNDNRFDGSMLGASQDMLDGRFVSCAPRYVNNRTEIDMIGAAYWTTPYDVGAGGDAQKLTPLDDINYFAYKNKLNEIYAVYRFGQAGFSAHFPLIQKERGSKISRELVLGAPGGYNWKGTTILYSDKQDVATKSPSISSGDFKQGPIVFAAFANKETDPFGLFGYALSSGNYFSRSKMLHAAGAPRSKQYGKVFLYEFPKKSHKSIVIKDRLTGGQVGEYFGAALTSCDINNDGYDDLIVGAPLFSKVQAEGRVVIYFGGNKETLKSADDNVIIIGSIENGRFGSTLSCADLDKDNYHDIVIAAPYEGDGVVYIYNGSPDGVSKRPTQRIAGSKVAPGARGFGYSISRGQDMDGNGYPDLAIGAYKSGNAVLLRTLPVIKFNTRLNNLSAFKRGFPRYSTKLQVEACVNYFGFNAPQELGALQILELDPKLQRLSLDGSRYAKSGTTTYESQVTLKLRTGNRQDYNCYTINITVTNKIENYLEPLYVSVEYKLSPNKEEYKPMVFRQNNKNNEDHFCNVCNVMMPNDRALDSTETHYASECGDDNICNSQLSIQLKFIDLTSSSFIVGSNSTLTLRVIVSNHRNADPAYLTRVLVTLSVRVHSLPMQCKEVSTGDNINISSNVLCDIANPLKPGKINQVDIELDMTEVSVSQGEMKVEATANTTSNNAMEAKDRAGLRLEARADITVSGKPNKEAFLFYSKKTEEHASSNISFGFSYQIEKFGYSPIDKIRLSVIIPFALKSGEQFVYFTKNPSFTMNGSPLQCTSELLMPRDKTVPPVTMATRDQRRRRSVESNPQVENTVTYPSNRTLYVNCTRDSEWQCAEIICDTERFGDNRALARLALSLTLNTLLLEPYMRVRDIILLGSEASVKVLSPENLQQPINGLPDFTHVNAVFLGGPNDEHVEAWVIALSVIVGILLLLALVIGLMKAGFFERKDKDALIEAQQEAEAPTDVHNSVDEAQKTLP